MVVTGGQRNDGVMLAVTLEDIYVPRPHGCPRTTPDAVMADRGYTSGVNRSYLRGRGIKIVIPEKKNEIAARKKRGSAAAVEVPEPPHVELAAVAATPAPAAETVPEKQAMPLSRLPDMTGRVDLRPPGARRVPVRKPPPVIPKRTQGPRPQ